MSETTVKDPAATGTAPAAEGTTVQKGDQMDDALQALLEGASGQGLERVRAGDAAIPNILLLQDISEQVKERSDDYIDGAKPGMILNSVSLELYSGEKGITVIPVFFNKVWNLWKKRAKGGGFIKSYKTAEEADSAWGSLPNKEDVDVVETAQHFLLVHSDKRDSWKPALLNLKVTGLQTSRQWVAAMQDVELPRKNGSGTYTPPSFGCMYQLTSKTKKGNSGEYFVFDFENVGVTPYPLAVEATEFYKLCSKDLVEVNYEKDAPTEPGPSGPSIRQQDPSAPRM
jgi:hypothetical protein